ncbi:MAG: DsbE family thiol:disulfide interchange protein [Arenicellales bacterium]|nr:DsbE family thiol:disulfide interchange protein [Arenicellales bacterium]
MTSKAVRYFIPLVVFIALAVFLGLGLKLDPRHVPSPLVGKRVPEFSLPRLFYPDKAFTPVDLQGRVWVLNVWASWCVACREEHDVLKDLVGRNPVTVIGLNYKDTVTEAIQWLEQLGNPYELSVVDAEGQVGIDWGVYGVPETFVIDHEGIIRYKHIGPISSTDVEKTILPLIEDLQRSTS